VRKLEARRARDRLGLFVCEGEDLVVAALDAGLEPVEALADAERPALSTRLPSAELVEPKLLAAVSQLAHPPRVVAIFRLADLPSLGSCSGTTPVGIALWRVGDPGNVGTIVRSADAFGPAFVCLSGGSADPTGPKALRASAGALFRVPVGAYEDAPGPRVALLPRGGTRLEDADLPDRTTFVLGAEREGLPADIVAGCDAVATIAVSGAAESLNVATAGAIALYEWRRRRLPQ
jgi:RNA methyltransferase, TrmH family